MIFYAPYNTKAKKYLFECNLFGNWSKQKCPKKVYSSMGAAKSALSMIFYPEDTTWEIHELSTRVERIEIL